MKYIGPHVSASGGVENAPLNAMAVGANAFALFTKNQRQWVAAPLTAKSIELFKKNCSDGGFQPEFILPHDSYLINLGNPDEDAIQKSRAAFLDEMQRCEQLGLKLLNFHPGSHVGQGVDAGIEQISDALKAALRHDYPVTVLLETMAGKGSEVGGNFAEIKAIIDAVGRANVGVCLDTCHVYDGGYDIVNDLDGVLREFDRVIGLDRLKALHLNDSKNPYGSHKDRHECIGEGSLGLETFQKIMNHSALADKPMILETPNELPGYAKEIALLRSM